MEEAIIILRRHSPADVPIVIQYHSYVNRQARMPEDISKKVYAIDKRREMLLAANEKKEAEKIAYEENSDIVVERRFCAYCGTRREDGEARFCVSCGRKLD